MSPGTNTGDDEPAPRAGADPEEVLRLCAVNPRTTREDVDATLARVEDLAAGG
jgi:hypothetical protein